MRAAVNYAQRAIMDKAKTERRALTNEEQASWDNADKDFMAFTRELEQIRSLADRDRAAQEAMEEESETFTRSAKPNETRAKESAADKFYRELFYGAAVPKAEAMQRVNQAADARRASTSSASDGLYVMPEEFISTMERTMKAFGGMLQASYIHRSSTGNPMRWPTHDGTADTGNWVAQPRSGAIVPRGLTFGRNSFSAHTWYDIVGMDWEFIQDEQVGLVGGILAEMLGESAGRALNKALTDGDGSGKPTGILDGTGGAAQGKETAANNAIVKTEFLDLVHSVDPAYRNNPKSAFMFNDNTLLRIRKLDFGTTDDEPIWQPSLREGEPDRILGYAYVINQDFPSLAASAKIAAFGDWSKYVVRQVRDIGIVRLDETFADLMQTAFLGWMRYDAKLINTRAIKLLQMKA